MSRFAVSLFVLSGAVLIYGGYCLAQREEVVTDVQSGIASWYGSEQQGQPTADGETFNRHDFTAASRHLPFNTIVKVTNQANGRSVNVRINDRGPYVKSRVLDLSEAAADSLDMKKSGTAPVKIEVVEPASAQAAASP